MNRSVLAALFIVAGCGRLTPTEPAPSFRILTPQCSQPALGPSACSPVRDSATKDYIILLRSAAGAVPESDRLSAKYGFEIVERFTLIPAFVAVRLTPETVARLRCEGSVQSVELAHEGGCPPP